MSLPEQADTCLSLQLDEPSCPHCLEALACRGLGGGMELFGACTCLDRACQWGRWCLRAQDRILMKMSFRGSTASPYLPVSSGNSAPQSAGRLTGFRALSARAFRATVLEGILWHIAGDSSSDNPLPRQLGVRPMALCSPLKLLHDHQVGYGACQIVFRTG